MIGANGSVRGEKEFEEGAGRWPFGRLAQVIERQPREIAIADEPHATRTTQPSRVTSLHLLQRLTALFFLCRRCKSFCHTTSLQQPVQFFAKVQCTSTEPTQQFNAPQGTEESKDFVRTRPHPTLYFH